MSMNCASENGAPSAVPWISTSPAAAGDDEIRIRLRFGVFLVVESRERPCARNAAGNPPRHGPLSGLTGRHPRVTIHWKQSWSATQPPVIAAVPVPPSAMRDVAVDDDLLLAEPHEIDHGTREWADQPLDLLGAPRGAADRRSRRVRSCVARAAWHIGRHPALAGARGAMAAPFPQAGGDQDVGAAELIRQEPSASGRHGALDRDGAQFVRRAAGWAHR